MIVGVTGFFAAGKDTVADYLVERKGFAHLSLSDIIRERLRQEGREVTIENLTETGNEMRRRGGPGVLAQMAIARMGPTARAVVTSIRHPAEVEALRRRADFALLFVDAPVALRYERSAARGRPGDCQSFEEFKLAEEQQMRSEDSHAQRLEECRRMADVVLRNDATIEALHTALEDALARVGFHEAATADGAKQLGAQGEGS